MHFKYPGSCMISTKPSLLAGARGHCTPCTVLRKSRKTPCYFTGAPDVYDYNSVLLTGAHILLALITYFHNLYSLLAHRTSRNCYWRSCYWRSCIQSASNRFFISCHRNGEQKIYLEIYVRQRISLLLSNRHILLTGTSTVT